MRDKCRGVTVAVLVFAVAALLGATTKAFVVRGPEVASAGPQAMALGQVRSASLAAAASAASGPAVSVNRERLGGREVATIVVNGLPVMRMREKYGRWSPYERAQIVRDRLQPLVAAGLKAGEVRAGQVRGSHVVQARGVDLITVMPFDAKLSGASRSGLANVWAGNLRTALGGGQVTTSGAPATGGIQYQGPGEVAYQGWPGTPAAEWKAPERYDDKWVPIVSVLSGLKLGVARVNGPVSKLGYVQAVAQLETHWKDLVEIDIFVPISAEVPGKTLDRIEGCAVTGFVDYDF